MSNLGDSGGNTPTTEEYGAGTNSSADDEKVYIDTVEWEYHRADCLYSTIDGLVHVSKAEAREHRIDPCPNCMGGDL